MNDERPTSPPALDYASKPKRSGWLSRLLVRMSQPMPMAMYFLVMTAMSVIALVLALLIRLVVVKLQQW